MNGLIDPAVLADALLACRQRSTQMTADLDGERLLGPRLEIVNPPLWELGHLAWFQEYWCLRRGPGGQLGPPIIENTDTLYDSARVAHETRWSLPLPDVQATRAYQQAVLDQVLGRLHAEPGNPDLQYFVQLAVFHEDMHSEAFHYTRQTLGYTDPLPGVDAAVPKSAEDAATEDVQLPGGTFMLGADSADGFVFDNEKWTHTVSMAPFRMARACVTQQQYLDFVNARGYGERRWWTDEGWAWRTRAGAQAPRYWEQQDGHWRIRRFDMLHEPAADQPVIHVNWHEANAWCRFAGRRLPTEAEWEYAAAIAPGTSGKRRYPWGEQFPDCAHARLEAATPGTVHACSAGDSAYGLRQMLGNVWEWTADTFEPYPGFVIDPYREYSQPWFGTHKVLRGGSFSTTRRLIRNTWRNFYLPHRNDIFAGFRTCTCD